MKKLPVLLLFTLALSPCAAHAQENFLIIIADAFFTALFYVVIAVVLVNAVDRTHLDAGFVDAVSAEPRNHPGHRLAFRERRSRTWIRAPGSRRYLSLVSL